MRDKAVSDASAQDGAAVSSSATIRGMANTLCDSDTDLLDTTAIVTRLVCAGWSSALIEEHYLAAVLMAMTRKVNEMRK